jgi:hypothetical protein
MAQLFNASSSCGFTARIMNQLCIHDGFSPMLLPCANPVIYWPGL